MTVIEDVRAHAVSFRVHERDRVRLGIGQAVKRDAVLVRVTASDGTIGWGESHHGRSPSSVAELVNSTMRQLVVGREVHDVVGTWDYAYRRQLASHGMGAGSALALSGIDMALWDIRAKQCGLPLYKLLGGRSRDIPAYAGGVTFGFMDPQQLVDEVTWRIEQGYRAVKLRVGDNPEVDVARVRAVRESVGPDVAVLVDANTAYDVAATRHVMPRFDDLDVGWLEEPFPPHDSRSYAIAATQGRLALAAGENHYTRFEFHRVIEDGHISILQPDLSKTGGLTEGLRVAALASAWKLPINPHTSATGLNMAASIHFLASIDNPGYFEADATFWNPFRSELVSVPYEVSENGSVRPLESPGIGVEVREELLEKYAVEPGPGIV